MKSMLLFVAMLLSFFLICTLIYYVETAFISTLMREVKGVRF